MPDVFQDGFYPKSELVSVSFLVSLNFSCCFLSRSRWANLPMKYRAFLRQMLGNQVRQFFLCFYFLFDDFNVNRLSQKKSSLRRATQ